MKEGVLHRFKDYLPIGRDTPIFTLGEGDTPLVKSSSIGDMVGCDELYFKLEGCNPTGSFKDRGMVVAVAKAMEAGGTGLICASTGNTSASAAAYGAYCDLPTTVVVAKGAVAGGKLLQAVAYGARILSIEGSFDDALSLVRSISERQPLVLVNSVNPHRIQGQKTAAFEIVGDLGTAPDYLFIPVGNAGNITAYWLGFEEAFRLGWTGVVPKMMGFQAQGAAPIVVGAPVEEPETVASAIRVGNPAGWKGAERARDASGGIIDAVSDDEIISAVRLLAKREGIFCEPASAAAVAGLLKSSGQELDLTGSTVICVITGTGLKDPSLVGDLVEANVEQYPADLDIVEKAITLA